MYFKMSRLGRRESGSVLKSVTRVIAPRRLAMSGESPAAVKMEAKESPITIVYCSVPEKQNVATESEGTQEVDSPTVRAHASCHVLLPVASQTRPTMMNVYAQSAEIKPSTATHGTSAAGELVNAAIPTGRLSTPTPTMAFTRLMVEEARDEPVSSASLSHFLGVGPATTSVARPSCDPRPRFHRMDWPGLARRSGRAVTVQAALKRRRPFIM